MMFQRLDYMKKDFFDSFMSDTQYDDNDMVFIPQKSVILVNTTTVVDEDDIDFIKENFNTILADSPAYHRIYEFGIDDLVEFIDMHFEADDYDNPQYIEVQF